MIDLRKPPRGRRDSRVRPLRTCKLIAVCLTGVLGLLAGSPGLAQQDRS